MKKILVLLSMLMMFVASSASANFISTYWDLNAVDSTYGWLNDGITESFYEITYFAQTTSVITGGGPGSTIVDSGLARSTGLNMDSGITPGDNEGHGSLYGLTFFWDDLTGVITSNDGTTITADYNSGTFDFYLNFDPYHIDDNDPSTFTDGELVATVEITSGNYQLRLDGSAGSSYLLYGDFSYILEGFWFDAATGQDLSLLDLGWVYAYTAGDNDPESLIITPFDGGFTVFSSHDSSLSIGVVPEPGTLLLLGAGLLGTGIYMRRRNRKA